MIHEQVCVTVADYSQACWRHQGQAVSDTLGARASQRTGAEGSLFLMSI